MDVEAVCLSELLGPVYQTTTVSLPRSQMHLHHHQNLNSYSVTSSKLSRQSCHVFSFWLVKNLADLYVRQQGQGFVLFCLPIHYHCQCTTNLLLTFFLKNSPVTTSAPKHSSLFLSCLPSASCSTTHNICYLTTSTIMEIHAEVPHQVSPITNSNSM